jgi:NADPH:quinone reductase-like Zn-dependent oxidoreductase
LGLDNLELTQRTVTPPGPGEVLVRVRAAALEHLDYIVG